MKPSLTSKLSITLPLFSGQTSTFSHHIVLSFHHFHRLSHLEKSLQSGLESMFSFCLPVTLGCSQKPSTKESPEKLDPKMFIAYCCCPATWLILHVRGLQALEVVYTERGKDFLPGDSKRSNGMKAGQMLRWSNCCESEIRLECHVRIGVL